MFNPQRGWLVSSSRPSGHILLVPSSAALSACSRRAPKLPVREGIDDFWAASARFGPAEPGSVAVVAVNPWIPTTLSFHLHSWCCCFSLSGYVLSPCLCLCSDLAGLGYLGLFWALSLCGQLILLYFMRQVNFIFQAITLHRIRAFEVRRDL